MSRLTFNEARHLYTLDGKPITGVTTILGVIAKPALINWAANMAVDYIQNSYPYALNNKGKINEEVFENQLKEARKAHTQRKGEAANIGTLVHKWIEKWIANHDMPLPEDEAQKKMCQNFIDWTKEKQVEFLASEQQVYSESFWFCGTFDFLAKINGRTYLGDIKTSSGIYDEMFAQCSGYQICYNEMYPDVKIDGHVIVNLKKDGKMQTKYSFDYAGFRKMFLGALAIYRQQNEAKKYAK